MVLKEILVLLDKSPNAGERLDTAILLAKQHGARILGLHVYKHHLFGHDSGNGAGEVWDLEGIFEQKCSRAGIEAEWRSIDLKALRSSVSEVVNHHAHFADMVVVGQSEPGSKDSDSEANLPERVVLGSGKPALILPYVGAFPAIGENVLVAWKSGRESTRAVTDALPLLQKANRVNVFEVNPTDAEKDDMESLCAHLERHDVHARIETSKVTELSVGDVLLNKLADEGNDLLVMGTFAHTHFGTYVLGEVARHVLRHMTVPVLMSH